MFNPWAGRGALADVSIASLIGLAAAWKTDIFLPGGRTRGFLFKAARAMDRRAVRR